LRSCNVKCLVALSGGVEAAPSFLSTNHGKIAAPDGLFPKKRFKGGVLEKEAGGTRFPEVLIGAA
jgi:hypothetical protein